VLTDTTTIRLHLPADAGQADRSYDIVVGSGVIGLVGPAIAATGARRTVVITDAAVADSHAATTAASLKSSGLDVATLTVPAGEASKSVAALERLWNEMARLAVDRQTHVVGVGGGVVRLIDHDEGERGGGQEPVGAEQARQALGVGQRLHAGHHHVGGGVVGGGLDDAHTVGVDGQPGHVVLAALDRIIPRHSRRLMLWFSIALTVVGGIYLFLHPRYNGFVYFVIFHGLQYFPTDIFDVIHTVHYHFLV
jgi:hypothetical protein